MKAVLLPPKDRMEDIKSLWPTYAKMVAAGDTVYCIGSELVPSIDEKAACDLLDAGYVFLQATGTDAYAYPKWEQRYHLGIDCSMSLHVYRNELERAGYKVLDINADDTNWADLATCRVIVTDKQHTVELAKCMGTTCIWYGDGCTGDISLTGADLIDAVKELQNGFKTINVDTDFSSFKAACIATGEANNYSTRFVFSGSDYVTVLTKACKDITDKITLLGKIKSLTGVLVSDLFKPVPVVETIVARKEICTYCPYSADGKCSICSCAIEDKTRYPSATCPKGKW